MHTSVSEIRSKLPDLHSLSRDYYLTPEVAFALWRSIYSADITVSGGRGDSGSDGFGVYYMVGKLVVFMGGFRNFSFFGILLWKI